MSDIPGFNPTERRAIEAAMIYRYGQLVELQGSRRRGSACAWQ
ncbi:MAG: hypothetical protein M5U07_18715 [Xanthobacteraceae bacterium]|nr:hypothetical protein [Xanthobacteraceae bacterium]